MTIGPSSRIMSLPWGVRTFSIQRDLILLSGAPTCLWHRLTNFTNSNQKRLDSVLKSSTKSSRDQFKTKATSQASQITDSKHLSQYPDNIANLTDTKLARLNRYVWRAIRSRGKLKEKKIWASVIVGSASFIVQRQEPRRRGRFSLQSAW